MELQGLRASISAAQAQTADLQRERDGLAEQAAQAQEQLLQVPQPCPDCAWQGMERGGGLQAIQCDQACWDHAACTVTACTHPCAAV